MIKNKKSTSILYTVTFSSNVTVDRLLLQQTTSGIAHRVPEEE